MSAINAIRFVSKDKNQFFITLKERVDTHFRERGQSIHANPTVIIKTIVLMSAYILPFAALIFFQPAFWAAFFIWILMGIAKAGIGMSIMHDANHGAFSSSTRINNFIGYSINMLGASVFNWKVQHNVLHHNFTNIVHHDEDIDDKVVLRLSPHTAVKKVHRFQWVFAMLIYSIVTLYWFVAKDFLQFARYVRKGIIKQDRKGRNIILSKIIAVKVCYALVFFGLPIYFGIPFIQVFGGFLLMHAVAGIVLTTIFQLAHTVEEATHPVPSAEGVIENDWAIHQMNTTVNFSPRNKILSWYVGGLNFQVEHHLFPRICHVHYPKIAPIVKKTAQEFGIPYLEHKTFGKAVGSHFATLRRFGKLPDLDEVMG